MLKYNIRTRSLADPGAIKNILTVENDVVPFDQADVLEQGCVNAFLGDSPRSPRPCDLLACQLASRREDHGQVVAKLLERTPFYRAGEAPTPTARTWSFNRRMCFIRLLHNEKSVMEHFLADHTIDGVVF